MRYQESLTGGACRPGTAGGGHRKPQARSNRIWNSIHATAEAGRNLQQLPGQDITASIGGAWPAGAKHGRIPEKGTVEAPGGWHAGQRGPALPYDLGKISGMSGPKLGE